MDPKTCYFCSEPIEPGTAKCPFCGEGLTGSRAKLRPIAWGSPEKPMTIAVIGWLMIVFGAFGLFGLVSSAFMFIFMGSNPVMNQSFGAPGSTQRTFMLVSTCLGGLSSASSVVAGAGRIMMRLWGRRLAIGPAIYTIVSSLIVPFFSLPATLESMRPAGMETFVIVTTVVSLAIGCAVQGLIIFFLMRPHVSAALQRAAEARA
jgi:hypothetical protein